MSDVKAKIKKIVADHIGIEEEKVTEEASFIDDLGADSLDTVELVMAFEEEFGSEISEPNSSSKAITSSTVSKLSAPKSSIKLASSVTFSSSIPKWSATIFLILLLISSDMNSLSCMFNFLID